MQNKFYLLKIINLKRETFDTVSITFEIPSDLKEVFKYKAGQYITIKIPINGEENRRAYSICTNPESNQDKFTITVKKIDDGRVSKYINENLKIGDLLEVMPPNGNFTIDDSSDNNTFMFFAGGSGITPIISLIKSILIKREESKIFLIYQNRNYDSIIFREELNNLNKEYSNFETIHILSQPDENWNGLKGRLNQDFVYNLIKEKLHNDLYKTEFFLCGPQGMMYEIEQALKRLLITSNKIHKENFTISIANVGDREDIQLEITDNLTTYKVKIILYGDEYEFDVEPDETILTAAQREGYDPPFSCQIGACSTCRARLKSGKIYMDERDSLTDEEIADGYVLTCQTHPLTDDVVIDYDDN